MDKERLNKEYPNHTPKQCHRIKYLWFVCVIAAMTAIAFVSLRRQPKIGTNNANTNNSNDNNQRAFRITYSNLFMQDGTRLAATFVLPVPKFEGERFPVLLEYLPYRKDDSFVLRDNPYFAYFGSAGFAVAKVDIRGSGASDGPGIPAEYTEIEMQDGEEIIRQLAEMPWSNGNIGMYGISWGAFNGLMLAARNPPALKTIVAVDGSHDVYFLDDKYEDGAWHIDDYIIEMDTENALPQAPNYALSEDYFASRFDMSPEHPPWTALFASHQIDDDFYRNKSVRYRYDKIRIPVYVVGGMHDLYGEFAMRVYEGVRDHVPKVKVVMGPWDHSWPEMGVPGPNYDGKAEAVRWFQQWLQGTDNGFLSEPDLTVFIQHGFAPDPSATEVPGQFRYEEWPIPKNRSHPLKIFPSDGQSLSTCHNKPCFSSSSSSSTKESQPTWKTISYRASTGTEVPWWWGELTPDQTTLDRMNDTNLSFDSEILTEAQEMVGFAQVSLRVRASAPNAHWVVRVEDVRPDGAVTLVTGALFNGCFRNGTENAAWIVPDQDFLLQGELHFITYRFEPGHRIRVSINNAALRLAWPTQFQMSTSVLVNSLDTFVVLPIMTPPTNPVVPPFTQIPYNPPQPQDGGDIAARGFYYDRDFGGTLTSVHPWKTSFQWSEGGFWNAFNNRLIGACNRELFSASDSDPAHAHWEGHGLYMVVLGMTPDTQGDCVPHQQSPGTQQICLLDLVDEIQANFTLKPQSKKAAKDAESVSIPNVNLNRFRYFVLTADVEMDSTETEFQVKAVRRLHENGILRRESTFSQTYPRMFQ